jgi:hypothetical protein
MSLSKLLPTLNNAGRRLVLSEVLGEPLGLRMVRIQKQRVETAHRLDRETLSEQRESTQTAPLQRGSSKADQSATPDLATSDLTKEEGQS